MKALPLPEKLTPGDLLAARTPEGTWFVWLFVEHPNEDEGEVTWVYLWKNGSTANFRGNLYTHDTHTEGNTPEETFYRRGDQDNLFYLGNLVNGTDWKQILDTVVEELK